MLEKIACLALGHRYHVKQRFSASSRRVECLHCGCEWGMNDDARALIPWDDELAEMYRSFGHTILR